MCICGTSALRRLLVKQSSLVDKIIELSRDPGSVRAGTFPDTTLLCTVYFMGLVDRADPPYTQNTQAV